MGSMQTPFHNKQATPDSHGLAGLSQEGLRLYQANQFEAAAAKFELGLQKAPKDAGLHFNLGLCYEKLGRWAEAGDAFEHSTRTAQDAFDGYVGLGIALLHQEKPEEALPCFDAALASPTATDEGKTKALFGKGVCLQVLGRIEEATAIYEYLLEADPGAEDCLANLADRKSTRLNSSHSQQSRMPSSA